MANDYGHPACFDDQHLLRECEIGRSRGAGPGGQHRNKVQTAVSIHHVPTGVTGAASERRSQEENRRVALKRLRLNLAVAIRHPITLKINGDGRGAVYRPSELLRSRVRGGRVSVSVSHRDFPAILAEVMDVVVGCGFDVKAGGEIVGCSMSQLVKLIKGCPRAFSYLNVEREGLGLRRLK